MTPKPTRPSATSPAYDEVGVDGGQFPTKRDCEGKLFIPHKTDCRKYYMCNHDKITLETCPNGLYWNKGGCDWPANTKCDQKPSNDDTGLDTA